MTFSRLVASAALGLAVSFGGCDGDGGDGQKLPSSSPGSTSTTPVACTGSGARDMVSRFLSSDEADGDELVAMFVAPEPEFEWFSAQDRIGMDVAADRDSLADYLTERRRRGVRQHLSDFRFNGIDDDHANFWFTLAEGVGEKALIYSGKGAIHCESGKIIVWSEGAPRQ